MATSTRQSKIIALEDYIVHLKARTTAFRPSGESDPNAENSRIFACIDEASAFQIDAGVEGVLAYPYVGVALTDTTYDYADNATANIQRVIETYDAFIHLPYKDGALRAGGGTTSVEAFRLANALECVLRGWQPSRRYDPIRIRSKRFLARYGEHRVNYRVRFEAEFPIYPDDLCIYGERFPLQELTLDVSDDRDQTGTGRPLEQMETTITQE